MTTNRTFKVYAIDGDGDIIGEMEFQGGNELDLFITVEAPALPERSPLHPEALNFDDLEVGLNVERHNIHGRNIHRVGIINGEVFLRGEKYQAPWEAQDDRLMVPVVTTDYHGRLVHEDWFLADMGIVPYDGPKGPTWNTQNYTLAVR
jgi:hypothetical protein